MGNLPVYSTTVQTAANLAVRAGSRLYTDSASSGRAGESRGVSVLLAQALPPGVSWCQQVQSAGVYRILSVPTQLSSAQCVRAGRADLIPLLSLWDMQSSNSLFYEGFCSSVIIGEQ